MMLRKHLSGINDASDKKIARGNYILRLACQKLTAPSSELELARVAFRSITLSRPSLTVLA
jgi:hypothetical protein